MGGGKKGQLGQDGVKQYPFGDLNPVAAPPTTPVGDPNGAGAMGMMRKAAQKALQPDARSGTSRYKGIVLRRNPDIVDASTTPKNSWIASFFGSPGSPPETHEQMPNPLQSYQIFIPELHAQLPVVKRYVPFDVADPEHEKIDRYPTFIANDSGLEQAAEGDLVWCSFGNNQTFEDPTYLGPVFPKPGPGAHGKKNSASDACNNSCGGGGGTGSGGGGVGGPQGFNGPMPAPGEGLEHMKAAQARALRNAGKIYKSYQNMAYASVSDQKKTCLSDPVKGDAKAYYAGQKRIAADYAAGKISKAEHNKQQAANKKICKYCFGIFPMPSMGSSGGLAKMNGKHGYDAGFLKFMKQGGRGMAVSGRVGPGSCANLPTQIERLLMAQRIVVEDQCGRGYGWGGKTWNHGKSGIDCSGFTFLSRCMQEVMISKDLVKLDGFGNQRFTGYHGKGAPDGNYESSCLTNTGLDQHWAPYAYGGNTKVAGVQSRIAGKGKYTKSKSPSSYGSYTMHITTNYRRGLYECISILGNSSGNPNTPWNGQNPVMPGDEILMGSKKKANFNGKRVMQSRTSGTADTSCKDLGITHVVCTFAGPDGELRVAESGGPYSGVGSRPYAEWWAKVSRGFNIFVWQPEEMGTAWKECIPLLDKHGIKHRLGRPLVPWTPDLAKILAPAIFGNLPDLTPLSKQALGKSKTTDEPNNPKPEDRNRSSKPLYCKNYIKALYPQHLCEPKERKTSTTEKAVGAERVTPSPEITEEKKKAIIESINKTGTKWSDMTQSEKNLIASGHSVSESEVDAIVAASGSDPSLLDKVKSALGLDGKCEEDEKTELQGLNKKIEDIKKKKAECETLAEKIKQIQYGLGEVDGSDWYDSSGNKGFKPHSGAQTAQWWGHGETNKRRHFTEEEMPADLKDKEQTEKFWCFPLRKNGSVFDRERYDDKAVNHADVPRLTEEHFFGGEKDATVEEKKFTEGLMFGWKYRQMRGNGREEEAIESDTTHWIRGIQVGFSRTSRKNTVRYELIEYYDKYSKDVESWLTKLTEQLKEAEEQKEKSDCKDTDINPDPTGTGQVGSGSTGTAQCVGGTGGSGGGGGYGGGSGGGGGGGGGGGPTVVDNGANPNYQGEGENMPLSQPKAKLVKVYFDNIRYDFCAGKGGGGRKLREDVANDLSGVIDVLHNLGGILAQVGTGRALSNYDPSKTNRSTTSFHYTYLAFDIYTHAASLYYKADTNICEYIITKGPMGSRNRYFFDIWARSDKPAGTEYKGHKVQRVTLDALVCKRSGPPQTVSTTGNFIMLTKVFEQYGFHRIVGRDGFYTNCKSGAASEWWHVQSHNKTKQGQTTWEQCLKTVHSDRKVECSPPYKHRKRVFRGKGFTGKSRDSGMPNC